MPGRGFNANQAQRRIIATVQRAESEPRAYTPPRRTPRLAGSSGNVCLTTSTITARSGTTPGTGTATVQNLVSGAFVAGQTINVNNFSATAIPSGKYCWADDGWVTSVEC